MLDVIYPSAAGWLEIPAPISLLEANGNLPIRTFVHKPLSRRSFRVVSSVQMDNGKNFFYKVSVSLSVDGKPTLPSKKEAQRILRGFDSPTPLAYLQATEVARYYICYPK